MFIRVHKSFIVAIKQKSSMEYGEINLKSTVKPIRVGSNYKNVLAQRFKDKFQLDFICVHFS